MSKDWRLLGFGRVGGSREPGSRLAVLGSEQASLEVAVVALEWFWVRVWFVLLILIWAPFLEEIKQEI